MSYQPDVTKSPLNTNAHKEHVTMTIEPTHRPSGQYPQASLSPTSSPQRRSVTSTILATAKNLFGLEAESDDPRYNQAEEMTNTDRSPSAQYSGFVAAKTGNVRDLERALNGGLDPNAFDGDFTLLMWCARTGAVPTAKILLERGAAVDKYGPNEMSALIIAAQHGYTAIVELLIHHGAVVNRPDDKGHSPLMYAVGNGHYNTSCCLIDKGANPHWLAYSGVDQDLVNEAHASIDKQFGLQPGTRAGLDWKEQSDGKMALHIAARYGHGRLVELLAQCGVNLNARDDRGYTAVMWATMRGNDAALYMLLQMGAKLDVPDNKGNTALMWAARQGNHRIVKILIDHGANVNYSAPEDPSRGPLTWAMQYSDRNMVALLKNEGANVRFSSTPRCCSCFRFFGC